MIAIANFYSLGKYMIANFETTPPTVWKAICQFVTILNSTKGREWGSHYRNEAVVFHNIIIEIQQVLNLFTRI
jgi:hypothetical protein